MHWFSNLLAECFGNPSFAAFTHEFIETPQQTGAKDCGVFLLVNAYFEGSLIYGMKNIPFFRRKIVWDLLTVIFLFNLLFP